MSGAAEIVHRSVTFANRFLSRNVRRFSGTERFRAIVARKFCSASPDANDPGPVFLNSKVQTILKAMTRADPERVFRPKMDGRRLEAPTYKFMTDEELQKTMKKAEYNLQSQLQMPPVVKVKEDVTEIISEDPELQDYDTSNYVFTDITYGLKNRDRLIVVRESTGTLRTANIDERKRMLQVYYPLKGREMFPPKLFFGEYFENLLNEQSYEHILNVATVQYDPDEPEWMRITHAVFDHIDQQKAYDKLLSTRFYGNMVFHYTWKKDIDNLLTYFLQEHRKEDALWLVQLYQLVHPQCESAKVKEDADEFELLMHFAENDAKNKTRVVTAVNVLKEWTAAKSEMEKNMRAGAIQ